MSQQDTDAQDPSGISVADTITREIEPLSSWDVAEDVTPAALHPSSCRPLEHVGAANEKQLVGNIPASAIADAFGNYDGQLTGYELQLRDRLLKLETGSRCWLGFANGLSPNRSRTGYSQSLNSILDSACDLDCGDDNSGLKLWDAPSNARWSCRNSVEIRRTFSDNFKVYNHVVNIYTRKRGLTWWTGLEVIQDAEVSLLYPPPISGGAFDEVAAAVLDYYSDGRPKCKARAEKRFAAWKKALAHGECPLERIAIFDNMRSLSHSSHGERQEDKYKVPKELRCEDDAIDFLAVIDWAAIRECPRTPGSDKLPELLQFFLTMKGNGWDVSDVASIDIYGRVGEVFHGVNPDWVRASEVAESLRKEGHEVLQELDPILPLGLTDEAFVAAMKERAENPQKHSRVDPYLKLAALGEHELVEQLLEHLVPEERPTREYWSQLAKHCWPREELIRKTER